MLECPTVEIVPPLDTAAVDQALQDLSGDRFDSVIFTSANGVRRAVQRLFAIGLDARAFGRTTIVAVGEGDGGRVADGMQSSSADVLPDISSAQGLGRTPPGDVPWTAFPAASR